MRSLIKKYTLLSFRHLFLIVLSVLMTYPIIWWLGASLKDATEMNLPTLFPATPIWDNYIQGWQSKSNYTFATFFKNSLVMGILCVIGSVASASICGFGFGRLRFKGRNILFAVLMVTMMLPGQVTIVPQFIYYHKLGLVDSIVPLVLPYCLGGPFFIYLVVQFVRGIPKDLDEAAKIDGASLFTVYSRIIVPLIKPPLVTVAIFTFIWSWDDFFSQVLYLSSVEKFTVSLALRMFMDQFEVKWGQLFAMSFLSIMPLVIVFMLAQKHFVEGIATTGLKG